MQYYAEKVRMRIRSELANIVAKQAVDKLINFPSCNSFDSYYILLIKFTPMRGLWNENHMTAANVIGSVHRIMMSIY